MHPIKEWASAMAAPVARTAITTSWVMSLELSSPRPVLPDTTVHRGLSTPLRIPALPVHSAMTRVWTQKVMQSSDLLRVTRRWLV